jgi:hypothetical protein
LTCNIFDDVHDCLPVHEGTWDRWRSSSYHQQGRDGWVHDPSATPRTICRWVGHHPSR